MIKPARQDRKNSSSSHRLLDTVSAVTPASPPCKAGTPRITAAPLADADPYGADPSGAFLNRIPFVRGSPPRRGTGAARHLPEGHASTARGGPPGGGGGGWGGGGGGGGGGGDAPCVTGLSHRRGGPIPTSGPKTGSSSSTRPPASAAGPLRWACPYGARENGPVRGT